MVTRILKTDRLLLRPLELADGPDIARLIGDYQVSKWLSVVPHPYALADAEAFIRDFDSDWRFGVEIDGAVAGVIGISDQLGYWLGREIWGRGYMGEAAQAVVREWFLPGNDMLASGYFTGNAASGAILGKLGFKPTKVEQVHSLAQGQDVALQRMHLNRADWQARYA